MHYDVISPSEILAQVRLSNAGDTHISSQLHAAMEWFARSLLVPVPFDVDFARCSLAAINISSDSMHCAGVPPDLPGASALRCLLIQPYQMLFSQRLHNAINVLRQPVARSVDCAINFDLCSSPSADCRPIYLLVLEFGQLIQALDLYLQTSVRISYTSTRGVLLRCCRVPK